MLEKSWTEIQVLQQATFDSTRNLGFCVIPRQNELLWPSTEDRWAARCASVASNHGLLLATAPCSPKRNRCGVDGKIGETFIYSEHTELIWNIFSIYLIDPYCIIYTHSRVWEFCANNQQPANSCAHKKTWRPRRPDTAQRLGGFYRAAWSPKMEVSINRWYPQNVWFVV